MNTPSLSPSSAEQKVTGQDDLRNLSDKERTAETEQQAAELTNFVLDDAKLLPREPKSMHPTAEQIAADQQKVAQETVGGKQRQVKDELGTHFGSQEMKE